MTRNDILTEKIIGCCYTVHRELGPGFSEKTYHNALIISLTDELLKFETEKSYSITYLGKKVGSLRLDLVINKNVIVELKSLTGKIPEIFKYQVLSYLKASGLKTGLLINFGNKSCEVKRFSC